MPAWTDAGVLSSLKNAGLRVYEYANEQEREAKIDEATAQDGIRFQRGNEQEITEADTQAVIKQVGKLIPGAHVKVVDDVEAAIRRDKARMERSRRAAEARRQKIISQNFNSDLNRQIEGTLPDGHVYELGVAGEQLQQAGIPALPIQLSASRLAFKSGKTGNEKHPFPLEDMHGLVEEIQNPVAVFHSETRPAQTLIYSKIFTNITFVG